MSHLRRRVVVVFALVFLVAMTKTNLRQQTALTDGIRSSRNCRVTTRVNTREVHDDGYESRKHANSHLSVAPPVMLELVLAGHEYATDFDSHYLWDLALSNVNIVLYRRQRADLPLRTWSNGCGMRAEERLLLPNHGRDAAAGVLRLRGVEIRRAPASCGFFTRTRRARLAHVVRNRLHAHHGVPRTRASSSQRQ